MTETVFVTNEDTLPFTDHWDGKPINFPPGETVEVPRHVAVHIFGYGDEDKVPYLTRLGWTKTLNDLPAAMQRLNLFKISNTAPEIRRQLSPVADSPPVSVRPASRTRDRGNGTTAYVQ